MKGTAKAKAISKDSTKEVGSGPESESPRAMSPQHHANVVSVKDVGSSAENVAHVAAVSSLAGVISSLTPPTSPEK